MKFYIKTYGCQMNERDSESAGVMLSSHGYIQTFEEAEADVYTDDYRDLPDTIIIQKRELCQE